MVGSAIKQHICTSSSTPASPPPPDLARSELGAGWQPTQTFPTAELRIILWDEFHLGNEMDFNCEYFKSAIAFNLTINKRRDRSKQRERQ